MFGETPIIGSKEVTIDDKNRIYLPSNTKVKSGETLGLLLDIDYDALYIMSEATLNTYRETIFSRYGIDYGKILDAEQTRIARKFYYCTQFVKSQTNSRVIIPSHFIEHLQLGEKVLAIGENDRLAICKDLDTYLLNDKTKKSL